MLRKIIATAASFLLAAVSFPAIAADQVPTKIGQCTRTTITELDHRLQHTSGSGSLVLFANGIFQVSYDELAEINDHSKVGDAVSFCLVELPTDCPPGDDRGKTYKTTNLRTRETWTLADSSHMCGGA